MKHELTISVLHSYRPLSPSLSWIRQNPEYSIARQGSASTLFYRLMASIPARPVKLISTNLSMAEDEGMRASGLGRAYAMLACTPSSTLLSGRARHSRCGCPSIRLLQLLPYFSFSTSLALLSISRFTPFSILCLLALLARERQRESRLVQEMR
jgi:hypothetical protein